MNAQVGTFLKRRYPKVTDPERLSCPVEVALAVVGGKWKPLILWHLMEGVHRFGELQRVIPGITRKVLTDHLRELEAEGVVTRKIYHQSPPKVEYSLSKYGLTLRPMLRLLCHWGERHERRVTRELRRTTDAPVWTGR